MARRSRSTKRDVDRALTSAASETGEDTVELQVQKITLGLPSVRPGALAKRYAEAEALRRKFAGCKTMASLAKRRPGAAFEDMKFIKPSTIPEPTRSLLLSAKDGDMLPPTTARPASSSMPCAAAARVKGDEKQRDKAQEELPAKEFEILAKRHLRDLRQDAHIEYR